VSLVCASSRCFLSVIPYISCKERERERERAREKIRTLRTNMTGGHLRFIFLVLCVSSSLILSISGHGTNDDISIIRERVLRLMVWPTGENISVTIQQALLFNRTLNSTCFWPDLDYFDQHVHWDTAQHMTRITTMLQAITVNGSTIPNDPTILSSVHCALSVWLTKDFRHRFWWYNKIGIPLEATKQLLMLGENVTSFEREKISDISYRADWWNGGSTPVGANLIWMIQVQLFRSLATTNLTGINQGFSKMWEDVTIKPLGGVRVLRVRGEGVEGVEGVEGEGEGEGSLKTN